MPCVSSQRRLKRATKALRKSQVREMTRNSLAKATDNEEIWQIIQTAYLDLGISHSWDQDNSDMMQRLGKY
jgi:hypothetical protein